MNLPTRARTRSPRLTAAIVGALTVWCAACGNEPTAPTRVAPPPAAPPPPSPMATISGTVWLHAADGVRPFANSSVFGWIAFAGVGRSTGRIPVDADGRYIFSAPRGSRVRLGSGGVAYQPCAVTVSVDSDVTRDVHVVDDPRQLGARLPPELLTDTLTLSGQVFELDESGRRPVADVRVETDGLFGLGLVTATTLTDAEGRYVLCGLQGDTSTVVFASKRGYQLFEATTPLNGHTTLDIEIRR